MLELRDFIARRGDFQLGPINLSCEQGLYGVLGENGAGKSTFLGAIAGAIPSLGSLRLLGEEKSKARLRTRMNQGFSYMTQETALVPFLSAAENLRLAGIDPKVLTKLELYEHRNRVASKLSGGQKRRLELLRTLFRLNRFNQPSRVYLLDEPLSGISQAAQGLCMNLVREVAQSHLVLMADHRLGPNEFDSTLLLERGTLKNKKISKL